MLVIGGSSNALERLGKKKLSGKNFFLNIKKFKIKV